MATLYPLLGGTAGTIGTKGKLAWASKAAPKMITPVDIPLWTKLATGDVGGDQTQNELVDAITAVTSAPTGVAIGVEPTVAAPDQNQSLVANFIQKIDDVWQVAEETERSAELNGYAGGIGSLVMKAIKHSTKRLYKRVEFAMLTKQTGQVDNYAGTAGYIKGVATQITTNANPGSAGGQPGTITDLIEAHVKAMLKLQFDAGCGPLITGFVPTSLADAWSSGFQGRPNMQIVAKQDETLSMVLEHYRAFSRVELVIVPNRTQSETIAAMLDLEQWCKRIFMPFEVRRYTDGRRNKEGYLQMSWSTGCGVEAASGVWFTAAVPTGNPAA